MTVSPRIFALFALVASALPFVAATGSTSCNSNEFWYENKSCCVKSGGSTTTYSPPSGKSCPSTGNWYWSKDKSCCLPSVKPPTGNPAPTCPKNFSWHHDDSCCNADTPSTPTTPSKNDCSNSEFWWEAKSCCLPHGGPPNPPKPPQGTDCPSSGWYWGSDKGCCLPHNPPSGTPQCPSGWDWLSNVFHCQPSTPAPQPTKALGHKRAHKVRSYSLCPSGHDACPIAGANGLLSDYECIDIQQELESCGGCTSMGAGQDCTSIQGAWNVGCQEGSCQVFSCMTGYRISEDRKSCIAL